MRDREITVRAVYIKSESLRDAIDRPCLDTYNTPGALKVCEQSRLGEIQRYHRRSCNFHRPISASFSVQPGALVAPTTSASPIVRTLATIARLSLSGPIWKHYFRISHSAGISRNRQSSGPTRNSATTAISCIPPLAFWSRRMRRSPSFQNVSKTQPWRVPAPHRHRVFAWQNKSGDWKSSRSRNVPGHSKPDAGHS